MSEVYVKINAPFEGCKDCKEIDLIKEGTFTDLGGKPFVVKYRCALERICRNAVKISHKEDVRK